MTKLFLFSLLVLCLQTNAQNKDSYWSVGVNPLGLVELTQAIGPCGSYRISPSFEAWGEVSYLFAGRNRINDWKNLQGYRFIFQTRYYYNRDKTFFIAPEFRLKHYAYNTAGSFVNPVTSDTLLSYPYHASQLLLGGALVFGGQVVLSYKHQLYLEMTTGLGAKHRRIKRTKFPGGYQYFYLRTRRAFDLSYDDDDTGAPYLPIGFRLIWKLN